MCFKSGYSLQTGLTKSSKESKVTEADAEQQVIDFLKSNGIKPGIKFK